MRIGLRVDVDTFRGTRLGVPALCSLLADHGVTATFFFSVGPDNMGRHLRRLVRPAFLLKMLRSGAPGLYGWDILLRGTVWPGPVIGERLADVIRATADAGHEVGLHGWDHHAWQTRADRMRGPEIASHLGRGMALLSRVLGRRPACSAVPGWKCNDAVLLEQEKLALAYHSDCRGRTPFRPVVEGRTLRTPQIPVTLPTYDEAVGRDGVTRGTYNGFIRSRLSAGGLNVLTIHAEAEGIACRDLFHEFLTSVRSGGADFVPLGRFAEEPESLPACGVVAGAVPGREGWVACQDDSGARAST